MPKFKRENIPKIEKQFLNAYEKLKSEWTLNKNQIEHILLNDKGLVRQKYNKKHVAKWIIEMDEYLTSDNPIVLFDQFKKFTSSYINESVKNESNPPEHPFFHLCDNFDKRYRLLISTLNKHILALKAELFSYLKEESLKW